MMNGTRSLWLGGLGAVLMSAAIGAQAQESGNSSAIIGPPQLKDFSLQPRERIVPARPPEQQPQPKAETPPPAPAERPARTAPTPAPSAVPSPAPRGQAQAQPPATARDAPTPAPSPAPSQAPMFAPPADALDTSPSEPAADPADTPVAPAAEPREGTPFWYYALPLAALALLGLVLFRRRAAAAAGPVADPVPVAAAPPPRPRPDPIPRPWLELSLKAERAAFTATEAELHFELEIANKGGSPATNLRIDVKMFNAGTEQDKEIGAFFKTAGRESTKCHLTIVEPGVVGVIKGSVRMPLEEMKAMRLDERLLFIPVVAVNGLYDYGENRTGQTSRSYVVGRELQEAGDKMGAFRVDQGPRVWRTVGQREHKLTKRV